MRTAPHLANLALWVALASTSTGSALAHGRITAIERARGVLKKLDPAPCVPEPLSPLRELRVAIVVYPDGSWALALAPAGTASDDERLTRLRACLERAILERLPPPLANPPRTAAVVARSWPLAPILRDATAIPRGDPARRRGAEGRLNDVCSWGQHRPDWASLPAPAPCGDGLTCCPSGGAAGSGSVCMAVTVGGCPAYP